MKLAYLKRVFSFESMIALVIGIGAVGWMDLTDPDYFWHLKNGQLIIERHELFSSDIYSHTAFGNYSLITGWLFDVTIAFLFDTVGPIGIKCISALFILLTWLAVYKSVNLYIARKQTAALLALLAFALLAPLLAVRPNLFTHAAFAWVLFILLAYCKHERKSTLLYLLPLFFVWPYFHFGFAAGLGLIGLFILAALLDKFLPRSEHQPHSIMISPWSFLIFFTAAAIATLNNYGISIYPELLNMTQRATSSPISEWESPDFNIPTQKILLASIFLYIAMLFLVKSRTSWLCLIVPGILLWSLLTAQRNQGFWAVVLPVFLAILISGATSNHMNVSIRARLQKNEPQPSFLYYVNGFILLLTLVIVIVKTPEIENKHLQRASSLLPVSAVDYLLENVPDGRLFNRYGSGGYLIWRTYPQFPVFVDGRFAPYTDQNIADAIHIMSALPETLKLLNEYKVEIVLVELDSALFPLMSNSSDHRLIYHDKIHSIFVLKTEKYSSLPTISIKTVI